MEPRGHVNQIVETAYAAHAATLARRLTALTRDSGIAEDLVQDAFVRLIVELDAGRIPDDLGAWLYRVGQNLAISRGRKWAVAARRHSELERPGEAPSPETMALESERQDWIRQALAGLNSTDRRALVLSASGFRGPEIAKGIGRTNVATRTTLCRARAKIRLRLLDAGAS